MPTFKRQAPLTPEGEYTGIIKGAGQETTKDGLVRFKLPIHTQDGKIINASVPFMDEYPNFIQNLVKSAGLQLPDGDGDPQITCDDLERLQVWFGIKHKTGKDGRVFANVNFHQKSYALQQNPSLGLAVFPQARKPGKLRSVSELGEDEDGNGSEAKMEPPQSTGQTEGPSEIERLHKMLEEAQARTNNPKSNRPF
jgi:hypothetical protein